MYNEVVYEAPIGVDVDMSDKEIIEYESPRNVYRFFKRTFDVFLSVIVLLLLLVPGLIVSLAICFSSRGAPIYAHERIGKDGKPFKVLKFRTMVADSDNLSKYLTNEQMCIYNIEHKIDDDPRITKLGQFLRKTSCDEIPQFINVLKGEMSVIGPRPLTKKELSFFGKNSKLLLRVRPGITGWWQVVSRNASSFSDGSRQALEMFYIENQSFSLDIKIFFKTFSVVLKKTGK